MKRTIAFLFSLVLVLSWLSVSCSRDGSPVTAEVSKARFFCPMHPTYTSTRPGDCPICNMKLKEVKDGTPGSGGDVASAGAHTAGDGAGEAFPPGRTAVMISPAKRQTIGLSLTPVEIRKLEQHVHATGVVVHDETRLARIAPRFGGWVQKLNVSFTGAAVEKGQPLFTVYSPELFAAESEYLLAKRQVEQAATDDARLAARSMAESARRKLVLLQVGEAELRALEERGQASDELVFLSPVSGHVISKTAVEGKAFMPGETLYEIGELQSLWLRVAVPERDFGRVKLGQRAWVTFPGADHEVVSRVVFIYPHLDAATRRGELRLDLKNDEHTLRPDMWASVELVVELGEQLAVPASAVIDTGVRCVAFVEGADHHLEPRTVKIGARTDDWWQVLGGLKEGEQVVTRALFLVDSESQLKAAIAGMAAPAEHQH